MVLFERCQVVEFFIFPFVFIIVNLQYTVAEESNKQHSDKSHATETVAIVFGSVFGAGICAVSLVLCAILAWKRVTAHNQSDKRMRYTLINSLFHPKITYRYFKANRLEKQKRKLWDENTTEKRDEHNDEDTRNGYLGFEETALPNEDSMQRRGRAKTFSSFGLSIYENVPKGESSSYDEYASVGTATRTPMTMMNETLVEEATVEPGTTAECWYGYDEEGYPSYQGGEGGGYPTFGEISQGPSTYNTFNDAQRFGDMFTPTFKV